MSSIRINRNKFNPAWFADDLVGEWVSDLSYNRTRAFCKFCGITLRARYSLLRDHAKSLRHKGNAEKIKDGSREILLKPPRSTSSSSSSSRKPAPKSKKIKSVSWDSVENEGYAYVEDGPYHPAGPSIFPTSCKPKEFPEAETADMPSEDSAIPYVAESSESYGFISSGTMGAPPCGPPSAHSVLYHYGREDSDDVNYFFGLSIAANLRKCSEEQASLARLKIQTILHQATLSELPL